ncbi:hypothetical protein FACS1894191_7360 [Clostridia bacterium]|nr:hypothetical protein FACS1894191_7360 [Clostridia bacterium]
MWYDMGMEEVRFYTHVERLFSDGESLALNDELEGMFSGDVFVTVKLDGSNGSVRLGEGGEVRFSSRNRMLTFDGDNQNFMNTFSDDMRFFGYLKKFPGHILFGEWMYTRGVLKYNDSVLGKFMVFDVYDSETEAYLSPRDFMAGLSEFGIDFVPVFAELQNPTATEITELFD